MPPGQRRVQTYRKRTTLAHDEGTDAKRRRKRRKGDPQQFEPQLPRARVFASVSVSFTKEESSPQSMTGNAGPYFFAYVMIIPQPSAHASPRGSGGSENS